MNLNTGAFEIAGTDKINASHLTAVFGLPEVCAELLELLAVPEFERAWEALQRDKKRTGEEINLVLLGDDGPLVEARPPDEVRAALDSLIEP